MVLPRNDKQWWTYLLLNIYTVPGPILIASHVLSVFTHTHKSDVILLLKNLYRSLVHLKWIPNASPFHTQCALVPALTAVISPTPPQTYWEHPLTTLSSVRLPCLLPRPPPCLANTSSFLFSFRLRCSSPSQKCLPWLKQHNHPQSLMAPIIPFFRFIFFQYLSLSGKTLFVYMFTHCLFQLEWKFLEGRTLIGLVRCYICNTRSVFSKYLSR